jgi:hypothetical protein
MVLSVWITKRGPGWMAAMLMHMHSWYVTRYTSTRLIVPPQRVAAASCRRQASAALCPVVEFITRLTTCHDGQLLHIV